MLPWPVTLPAPLWSLLPAAAILWLEVLQCFPGVSGCDWFMLLQPWHWMWRDDCGNRWVKAKKRPVKGKTKQKLGQKGNYLENLAGSCGADCIQYWRAKSVSERKLDLLWLLLRYNQVCISLTLPSSSPLCRYINLVVGSSSCSTKLAHL